MSDIWHISPLPNTEAIVTIKDQNGLEVANCIAEDAPLIAAAPELAAALRLVRGLVVTHGDAHMIGNVDCALAKAQA